MKQQEFKNDAYRKARGNYSRLLTIYCGQCGKAICLYQKDGHEYLLKRMYTDRILAPEELVQKITTMKNLDCPYCHTTIGIRYIYEKENRPAFLMQKGKFTKKVTKGIFV